MAKIPQISQDPVSLQVPAAPIDVSRFGQSGRSLAGLGAQIADTASKIAQRRKHFADQEQINLSVLDANSDAVETYQKMKLNMVDGKVVEFDDDGNPIGGGMPLEEAIGKHLSAMKSRAAHSRCGRSM